MGLRPHTPPGPLTQQIQWRSTRATSEYGYLITHFCHTTASIGGSIGPWSLGPWVPGSLPFPQSFGGDVLGGVVALFGWDKDSQEPNPTPPRGLTGYGAYGPANVSSRGSAYPITALCKAPSPLTRLRRLCVCVLRAAGDAARCFVVRCGYCCCCCLLLLGPVHVVESLSTVRRKMGRLCHGGPVLVREGKGVYLAVGVSRAMLGTYSCRCAGREQDVQRSTHPLYLKAKMDEGRCLSRGQLYGKPGDGRRNGMDDPLYVIPGDFVLGLFPGPCKAVCRKGPPVRFPWTPKYQLLIIVVMKYYCC